MYCRVTQPADRVTMETETRGPKSTCWETTHAESTFLHIKISCCMELVEFFVLALGIYFYKNMKWYFLGQNLGIFSWRGEEEKMLHKNNVGARRMNHSMYIPVLAR